MRYFLLVCDQENAVLSEGEQQARVAVAMSTQTGSGPYFVTVTSPCGEAGRTVTIRHAVTRDRRVALEKQEDS